MKNRINAPLVHLFGLTVLVAVIVFSIAACPTEDNTGSNTHTHSYSAAWSTNTAQHWHECSCGDRKDAANHIGDPCAACGYLTGGGYSLDGTWKDSSGAVVTITGNRGIWITLGSLGSLWQDAVNKNYIGIGSEYFRNISKTNNLTGTGQVRTVSYNTSSPNVATGTNWRDCTFTLNANGQTFQEVTSQSTNTWTRTAPVNPGDPIVQWPPANAIQLTAGQWANGNIPSAGGEQWFKFTATASTQYIHGKWGSLSDIYVQVYDRNGNPVGDRKNLYGSSSYNKNSWTGLTSNQIYYIKVTPFYGTGSGTYQIAFNTTSTTPGGSDPIGGAGSVELPPDYVLTAYSLTNLPSPPAGVKIIGWYVEIDNRSSILKIVMNGSPLNVSAIQQCFIGDGWTLYDTSTYRNTTTYSYSKNGFKDGVLYIDGNECEITISKGSYELVLPTSDYFTECGLTGLTIPASAEKLSWGIGAPENVLTFAVEFYDASVNADAIHNIFINNGWTYDTTVISRFYSRPGFKQSYYSAETGTGCIIVINK